MFDRIYYINLDRRPDRNENVKKIIKHHDLEKITFRVTAEDGSKLNLDLIPETIVTKKGVQNAKNKNMRAYVPMTPGAIGCALSHKKIWSDIVNNGVDSALILEDDIKMDENFNHNVKALTKYLPSSYDMIFLGYHPSSIKYIDQNNRNKVFVKSRKVYGLFGYVVTLKGAEKLLNLFPIEDQIDTEIYRGFDKIDAYVVKPNMRIITSEPSEIAKEFGTDIQVRNNTNQNTNQEQIQEGFDDKQCIMDDAFNLIMLVSIVALLIVLIDVIIKLNERTA